MVQRDEPVGGAHADAERRADPLVHAIRVHQVTCKVPHVLSLGRGSIRIPVFARGMAQGAKLCQGARYDIVCGHPAGFGRLIALSAGA